MILALICATYLQISKLTIQTLFCDGKSKILIKDNQEDKFTQIAEYEFANLGETPEKV